MKIKMCIESWLWKIMRSWNYNTCFQVNLKRWWSMQSPCLNEWKKCYDFMMGFTSYCHELIEMTYFVHMPKKKNSHPKKSNKMEKKMRFCFEFRFVKERKLRSNPSDWVFPKTKWLSNNIHFDEKSIESFFKTRKKRIVSTTLYSIHKYAHFFLSRL